MTLIALIALIAVYCLALWHVIWVTVNCSDEFLALNVSKHDIELVSFFMCTRVLFSSKYFNSYVLSLEDTNQWLFVHTDYFANFSDLIFPASIPRSTTIYERFVYTNHKPIKRASRYRSSAANDLQFLQPILTKTGF